MNIDTLLKQLPFEHTIIYALPPLKGTLRVHDFALPQEFLFKSHVERDIVGTRLQSQSFVRKHRVSACLCSAPRILIQSFRHEAPCVHMIKCCSKSNYSELSSGGTLMAHDYALPSKGPSSKFPI